MKKIKLSEWAKLNNVCYKTAWNYYKEGRFGSQVETNEKGSIFVLIDSDIVMPDTPKTLDDLIKAIELLGEIIRNK